jgi:hypothetical protein
MIITVEYNKEAGPLDPMKMLITFMTEVSSGLSKPEDWTFSTQKRGRDGDYVLTHKDFDHDPIIVEFDQSDLMITFDYHGKDFQYTPVVSEIVPARKRIKTWLRKMKKNAKMYEFAVEMRKYLKSEIPVEWRVVQEDDDGENDNTIYLESDEETVTIERSGTDLMIMQKVGKKERTLFRTSLYDGEAHKQLGDFLADLRGNQVLHKIYCLLIRHCDTPSQIELLNELKTLVPKPAVRSHVSKLVNDYRRLKNGQNGKD